MPGGRFIGVAGGKVWVGHDPGSAAINLGFATLHSMTPGASAWDKSGAGFPAGGFNNQADDIAYDASTGTYYAYSSGLGGGVFKSTDGVNWTLPNGARLGIGLPTSVVAMNGVVHAAQPGTGIRRSTDNGDTYARVNDGFITGVNGAGHLVNHNGRVIFTFANGNITWVNGVPLVHQGVVYSDDNGLSWSYVRNTAAQSKDAQSDGTTVFFGGTLFSANGGVTTDPLDQTGVTVTGQRTRIIRVGDTLFMHTTDGTLFRRDISTLDLRASTQIAVQPVQPPPLIEGDSHTFVVVAGGENLIYKWKKDNADIPGATGPSYTIDPAMASHSGSYTVEINGDLGMVTSDAVTLTVQIPEDGKDDPTFPESPTPRSTALLAVLDDGTVVENDANYLQRYGNQGRINQRTFDGSRFFFQVLDTQGRLVMADDLAASAGQVVRIDPKSLADDPTFTTYTIDANDGFTAIQEWPGRGYLVAPERYAERNGVPLDSLILLDYRGIPDPSFNVGDAPDGNFRRQISRIAVTDDGSIFTFSDDGLQKINHNGSNDAGFTPATTGGTPWAISGNRILISNRTPWIMNTDGSRDISFNAANSGFNRDIFKIVEQADGKFIVIGDFSSYGNDSIVDQIRLNADGTRDSTFFDQEGYLFSSEATDIAYDPRGFAYLSPDSTSGSRTYQDSGKNGIVRIFAGRGTFGILTHPVTSDVDENGTAFLSVATFGDGLTFQWRKDGVDIPGATSSTLTIPNFVSANNGAYSVVVSDGMNTQTSYPANLKAVGAPVILLQPESQSNRVNDDVTFAVAFEGASGATFQWRKNGVDIMGAMGRTLALSSVQFVDGGRYSVVIMNSFGMVTSADATLEVRDTTGIHISGFTPPTFNDDVWVAEPAADGTILVGGEFTTVGGVAHGLFTRLDKDGNVVTGWHEASPGGATGTMVRDFEPLQSGKILMAGNFSFVQGTSISHLARLNDDGTIDGAFTGSAFNQTVRTVVELGDNKLLAGGQFTSPDQHLVLLNADGSHDNSFDLDANSTVSRIEVQEDGKIIVAGSFSTLGGQTANYVARLNADLTRDTSFNAPAMNGSVNDVAVDGDGGVIIGGTFTQVDGQTRNRLARLNPDGSLDLSFDPGSAFLAEVHSVHIQLNGRIVVGGGFTGRVDRLHANGSNDGLFNRTIFINSIVYDVTTTPDGCLIYAGRFTQPKSHVAALTTDAADPAVTSSPRSTAVDLGGDTTLSVSVFSSMTPTYQWFHDGDPISGATMSSYTINSATKADAGAYLVDVSNATGTASSSPAIVTVLAEPVITQDLPANYTAVTMGGVTLTAGIQGRGPLTYVWKKETTTLSNGGRITGADTASLDISAVELSDAGSYSLTVMNDLGMVTTMSTLVTVIEPPAGIRTGYNPANLSFTGGSVYEIEPLSDGSLLVGGFFTQVNGSSRPYLAKIKPDRTLDTTFNPTINSQVYDIDVDSMDRIVIGGNFSQVNGMTRSRVARLNADGSLDMTFDSTSGANSTVYTVTALSNGQVFIGGRFSAYAGNSTQGQYGALLNGDGALDTNFDLNPNHYVWESVEVPGPAPQLLIGSQGTLVNGNHAYIRRVNLDASLDESFLPSLNNLGAVYNLLLQPDGKVVASGAFNLNNGFVRFNTDGSVDSSFSQQSSLYNAVDALAQQIDGRIVAGGSFINFNGESMNRLARVNLNGSTDPQFDIGTGFNSGTVRDIHIEEDGKIWLGGSFTAYDGTTANGLIQLNGDPVLLAILDHPMDTNFDLDSTINLSVRGTGTTTLNYQWRKDGNNLPGATGSSLSIPNAARTDSGNYDVIVSNLSGSQTSRGAQVNVLAEPVVLTHPLTQSVSEGSLVTFEAEAIGASSLSYQWHKVGGGALNGETGSSLTLNAGLADAGCYYVEVSNGLGMISSLPAGLGVYKAAGTIDTSFDPGTGPNNTVFASAALPNGNIAIAGSFLSVNGVSRVRFAILDPQGNVVDLTQSVGVNPAFGQTVLSLAAQPDGKIIYGLNADGNTDGGFDSSGNWTPKVAVHGNYAYFGGWFGTFERGLLRVDITTGQKDGDFSTKAQPSNN